MLKILKYKENQDILGNAYIKKHSHTFYCVINNTLLKDLISNLNFIRFIDYFN